MLGVTNLAGFGAGLSVVAASVTVLHERVGNVNSTPGGSASWSLNVGSGSGRVALVAAKVHAGAEANIDALSIGGVSATQQGITAKAKTAIPASFVETRLFVLDLSANGLSGAQTVTLGVGGTVDAFGLDLLVVQGLSSLIAEDSAADSQTSSDTLQTGSGIEASAGGITIGSAVNATRSIGQTWGNLLTERSDVATGGGSDDCRSGFAYDLGLRSSTKETVSLASTDQGALTVSSFR